MLLERSVSTGLPDLLISVGTTTQITPPHLMPVSNYTVQHFPASKYMLWIFGVPLVTFYAPLNPFSEGLDMYF